MGIVALSGSSGTLLEKLYYNADGLCKSFNGSGAEILPVEG